MKNYGKELILDLHNCNIKTFNRSDITAYFKELCTLIDMEACDLHFWDDLDTPEEEKQTDPKTKGTSAIQFIITSNVTIHTLDILKRVYINLFSCKDFDDNQAADFTVKYFGGSIIQKKAIKRI